MSAITRNPPNYASPTCTKSHSRSMFKMNQTSGHYASLCQMSRSPLLHILASVLRLESWLTTMTLSVLRRATCTLQKLEKEAVEQLMQVKILRRRAEKEEVRRVEVGYGFSSSFACLGS